MAAKRCLVEKQHPRHAMDSGLVDRSIARFEQEVLQVVGSHGSAEILPQLAPAPAEGLDWFTRGGPKCLGMCVDQFRRKGTMLQKLRSPRSNSPGEESERRRRRGKTGLETCGMVLVERKVVCIGPF